MFRVHFTAADIARTRIAQPPGPLAEVVFSLDALQRPGHDTVLDGWRRRVEEQVGRDRAQGSNGSNGSNGVRGANGSNGTNGGHGSARADRVLAEPLPRAWALDLLVGGGRAGEPPDDEAAAVLRAWFRVAVAPYWVGIRAVLEAERRRLTRLVGEHGVEALLASLHPSMRWKTPVLHIRAATGGTATDGDLHLDGRGLAIVPSLFCPAAYPVCRDRGDAGSAEGREPLSLYYPALGDPFLSRSVWADGHRHSDASLVALLGKTRARVLQALGEGDGACSTTELAERAGVAVSSASEHATVLRRAGLVASRRDRSTVFHWLTALGVGLLDGDRPSASTVARPGGARTRGR